MTAKSGLTRDNDKWWYLAARIELCIESTISLLSLERRACPDSIAIGERCQCMVEKTRVTIFGKAEQHTKKPNVSPAF